MSNGTRTRLDPSKPAGRYKQTELRPLPMRISQATYEALEKIRDFDNVTVQEHVRRALDYYVDHVRKSLLVAAHLDTGDAVERLKERLNPENVVAPDLVPNLLAQHAPRPVRSSAPKVVAK